MKKNLLEIIFGHPEAIIPGITQSFNQAGYQKDNPLTFKREFLSEYDKAEITICRTFEDKVLKPILGYIILVSMYSKNKIRNYKSHIQLALQRTFSSFPRF